MRERLVIITDYFVTLILDNKKEPLIRDGSFRGSR